jgi:hypothetical protein
MTPKAVFRTELRDSVIHRQRSLSFAPASAIDASKGLRPMQLELKYNLIVDAVSPGSPDRRPHLAVRTETFEVREFNSAQAPIAFRFRAQHRPQADEFRYDDESGLLYGRLGKLSNLAKFADNHGFNERYPTFPLQNGIYRSMAAGLIKHEHRATPFESLSRVDGDQAAHGRAKAEECVSGVAVVDGVMWRAVREPVFHVYRTNVGWKTELESDPSPRAGMDRRHFYFDLDHFEEMTEWKRYLSRVVGSAFTEDEFELGAAYVPRIDGYALDVEMAVRDLVERFSLFDPAKGEIAKKPVGRLDLLPLPLLEALVDARRYLAVPCEERTEAMHDAMIDLIERLPMLGEACGVNGLFAKERENAFHVEKWRNRPISLGNSLSIVPRR